MTQKSWKIMGYIIDFKKPVCFFFSEKGAVSNFFFRKGGDRPKKVGNLCCIRSIISMQLRLFRIWITFIRFSKNGASSRRLKWCNKITFNNELKGYLPVFHTIYHLLSKIVGLTCNCFVGRENRFLTLKKGPPIPTTAFSFCKEWEPDTVGGDSMKGAATSWNE
jgi:hypothetical protein